MPRPRKASLTQQTLEEFPVAVAIFHPASFKLRYANNRCRSFLESLGIDPDTASYGDVLPGSDWERAATGVRVNPAGPVRRGRFPGGEGTLAAGVALYGLPDGRGRARGVVAVFETGEDARPVCLCPRDASRQVLAHEAGHRVKNTLQIVTGLLAVEMGRVAEPAARETLRQAHRRLLAAARIQERLSASAAQDRIDLIPFLEAVGRDVIDTVVECGGAMPLAVAGDPVDLPAGSGMAIALIVTELLTNAVKYAYPGESSGRVDVICEHLADRGAITVRDYGRGLPAGFDPKGGRGQGLRVTTMLAEGLGGGLSWWSEAEGAAFRVDFPLA